MTNHSAPFTSHSASARPGREPYDRPGQAGALGRQAKTPLEPGFEPVVAVIKPLGDIRPVARAAEPAPTGAGKDHSVAAFWAY